MAVYRLTPIDLDDPNWSCSTWREACLVYAKSEQEARDAATAKFRIATERNPNLEIPQSPWNNSDLVQCVEAANYTDEVPSGQKPVVLLPRDAE